MAPKRPAMMTYGVTRDRSTKPLPTVFRDRRAKHERRDEVEKRGPHYRLTRREHSRGHDGGDGIRRIVETVDVVEHQCDRDDQDGECEDGSCLAVLDHHVLQDVGHVLAAIDGASRRTRRLP